MAKVLLLNPSKWGRGITPLWIPSHSAILKSHSHEVRLFDCSFYRDWMVNETKFNTENKQYKPTNYKDYITSKKNVLKDLSKCIKQFKPDIIFWSAISSNLHGEGEYVNIQYGSELMEKSYTYAIKIVGGLQVTADPIETAKRFPVIDCFIGGESEFVLCELANNIRNKRKFLSTKGLIYRKKRKIVVNPKQEIVNMKLIPVYDYSLFERQIFFRPYNGKVVKAVDYELSRGCIYTCSYCVESIIQKYYGFNKNKRGVLCNASKYLRNKSARQIFYELKTLNKNYKIELIRCQDANFLTINRKTLNGLANFLDKSDLNLKLYIETRPENIGSKEIKLLKRLKVDGIGMGIETAPENFLENNLNRFSSKKKIIKVFKLLKKANIKRTTYNIIGLPKQTEKMIIETIKFNQLLNPDNITVAFYSPYIGTEEQIKSKDMNYFNEYEYNIDGQLRTVSKSTLINKELLEFYKKYFVHLVRNGLGDLKKLKEKEKI